MKSFLQMWAMMPVAKASPITFTMVRNLSLPGGEHRWDYFWTNFVERMKKGDGRGRRLILFLFSSGEISLDLSLTMPNLLRWWEWCRPLATRRMSARSPWWPARLVESLQLRCSRQSLWCWRVTITERKSDNQHKHYHYHQLYNNNNIDTINVW